MDSQPTNERSIVSRYKLVLASVALLGVLAGCVDGKITIIPDTSGSSKKPVATQTIIDYNPTPVKETTTQPPLLPEQQEASSPQIEIPPAESIPKDLTIEQIQTKKGEWKRPFPTEIQRRPYEGLHSGYIGAVDIPLPEGTELFSISNGVVIQADFTDTWDPAKDIPETRAGISLTVMTVDDTGRPMLVHYSHCQSLKEDMKPGQTIKAGDSIGSSGHTGNASRLLDKYPYDANQLHFGLRPLDESLNDGFNHVFVNQVLQGGPIPKLPYNTVRGGTQYDIHSFVYTLLSNPSQAAPSQIYNP